MEDIVSEVGSKYRCCSDPCGLSGWRILAKIRIEGGVKVGVITSICDSPSVGKGVEDMPPLFIAFCEKTTIR